jgi:hypothetical protein
MANCSTEATAVKTKQDELNTAQANLNVAQDAVNTLKQQLDTAITNLIRCVDGTRIPTQKPPL